MHSTYEKVTDKSTPKETYSKTITAKPHDDVKSSNTNYVHEFRDKTVVNFIYHFFLIGYFCFVSFIVKVTFFALTWSGKFATKCSAIFLIALSGSKVKLIFKLLILRAFLGPYHRYLLSQLNESMTSIAYLRSYEFERIPYTNHSINREKHVLI